MNDKKPGNPWTKSLLIWVGVLFGLVLFVQMIEGPRAAASQAIPYSEFVRQVDEGTVKSVTTSTNTTGNQVITGKLASGEAFQTTAPGGTNIADRLVAAIDDGRTLAIANAVSIEGSAPRTVGTSMAFDGTSVIGSIAGGYVDGAVVDVC